MTKKEMIAIAIWSLAALTIITSLASCTKPTEENGTIVEPEPVTQTVSETIEPPKTDTSTGTTDTAPPKEDDGYAYVYNWCEGDYRPASHFDGSIESPYTCAGNEVNPHTILHGNLAVANGHELRGDRQGYIDKYVDAREAWMMRERFYNSISHLTIVIEDNTEFGSFSSAGPCGVSMHDGDSTSHETFDGILTHEVGHSWNSFLSACHQETINGFFSAKLAEFESGQGAWYANSPHRTAHYQLSNEAEYVACAIAAYFGHTDGNGTIGSLEAEDPDMYNFINTLVN